MKEKQNETSVYISLFSRIILQNWKKALKNFLTNKNWMHLSPGHLPWKKSLNNLENEMGQKHGPNLKKKQLDGKSEHIVKFENSNTVMVMCKSLVNLEWSLKDNTITIIIPTIILQGTHSIKRCNCDINNLKRGQGLEKNVVYFIQMTWIYELKNVCHNYEIFL